MFGFEPLIKFNVFTIINFELNQQVKTCKPAMGFSFAAGTTDGPGAFNFTQGICCSHFLSILCCFDVIYNWIGISLWILKVTLLPYIDNDITEKKMCCIFR